MKQVIHKQVISLATAATGLVDQQAFEVPAEAEMVDIQWDTRDPMGIAFWYKVNAVESISGLGSQVWRFLIRGTGHEFPEKCTHLSTVVRDGYAWHVLDYDGNNIPWADL